MRKIFPIPFICTRFVVVGVLSPALDVLTALILCPLASLIVTTFALVRKLVRSCRDNFMFHAFIKPLARVPANDSFAARRIAGPGLASNFLYQIRAEQALAAVFLHVEKAILSAYIDFIDAKLSEPLTVYKQIFGDLMNKYAYSLSVNLEPYSDLSKEVNRDTIF
jgi:hypothetical protein